MATRQGHTEQSPIPEVVGELTPLDEALLGMIPDEGAKLGYHWLGPQVPTMVEQLNKDVPVEHRVTSEQVAGRLGTLEKLGLIKRVTVQPVQSGKGSQITTRGREALALLRGEGGDA